MDKDFLIFIVITPKLAVDKRKFNPYRFGWIQRGIRNPEENLRLLKQSHCLQTTAKSPDYGGKISSFYSLKPGYLSLYCRPKSSDDR
ncbi:MAG: hypothetical protein ACXV74_10320 [Methylobacter sp.]